MNDSIIIPLTQNQFAVIDPEDLARVDKYLWSARRIRNRWYAVSGRGSQQQFLHRFVMNAAIGETIDHRDNDGLNCRKENLRRCTHGQNMANQLPKAGRFKGVVLTGGRWRARIGVNKVKRSLGTFATAEEAARAYDSAAKELYGEFACLNFPELEEEGYAPGDSNPEPQPPEGCALSN